MLSSEEKCMIHNFLVVMQSRAAVMAGMVVTLLSHSLEMHFGSKFYREIIHMFACIVI